MKPNRIISLVIMLAIVAGALVLAGRQEPASAQGQNLLTNPSFEGAYSSYIPQSDAQRQACPVGECTTAQMPAGWFPWWVIQTADDEPWENRMPEYKPVCPFEPCPYTDRLKDGPQALQYFTFHSTHTAGAYQRVNVPANANLKFSIWGMAWSSASDATFSDFPTTVNMRIGIDPTGDANPFSPNIVWSGYVNPYDAYVPFEVTATAQGSQVTVFMWSQPVEARKHNDIYWDGASLVVTGQGAPAPAPQPAASGGAQPAAPAPVRPAQIGPTPTPNADGVIQVEVAPGDTLWSIAARAGLTLDELLELNNLSRDSFINAGDIIIIGYGDGAAPAEEEEMAETAAAASEETESGAGEEAETAAGEESDAETAADGGEAVEEEAPAPPEPTATPQPTTGQICLRAFDDSNGDGFFNAGEPLKSDVAITIANGQTVVSNYITTGAEPFCIEGLETGTYRVSRSFAPGEIATGAADWGITLAPGMQVDVDFGSQIDETAAAPEEVAAVSADTAAAPAAETADTADVAVENAATAGNGSLLNWVVGIIVGVAVLLLLGVGFIVFSARRTG